MLLIYNCYSVITFYIETELSVSQSEYTNCSSLFNDIDQAEQGKWQNAIHFCCGTLSKRLTGSLQPFFTINIHLKKYIHSICCGYRAIASIHHLSYNRGFSRTFVVIRSILIQMFAILQ